MATTNLTPIVRVPGLSQAANKRLISVSVDDAAGIKSDKTTIKLSDRDYSLEWPPKGQIIQVELGYKETFLMNMGTFEIDSVKCDDTNSGATISFTARALMTHNNEIKKPRTEFYDEPTLGGVIGQIAGRNGYSAEVDGDVAGIGYSHLDQTEESDINFVSRLAEQHDCYAKLQDKKILFKPREKTNGVVTVDRGQKMLQYGSYVATTLNGSDIDSRPKYKGVKTYWENRETIDGRVYETVGSEPFFEVKERQITKAHAKMKAANKLKQLGRGTGKCSLSIPGDPKVRAEMDLILVMFRPELCALSPWIITQATHTFDSSGYKTKISAEVNAG